MFASSHFFRYGGSGGSGGGSGGEKWVEKGTQDEARRLFVCWFGSGLICWLVLRCYAWLLWHVLSCS